MSLRDHALTLIGLLVAGAIIAIPAAMLLPVLQRARDSAQTAAGISNLKQLSAAMNMYGSDSDIARRRRQEERKIPKARKSG